MTTLYLVRHGDNDWLDKGIAGRTAGVRLNAKGREQIKLVAERLSKLDISVIYSSPLERAQESAAPLTELLGLPIIIDDDLNEVDFGVWNGCSHDKLNEDPRWHEWNRSRSTSACPNGEAFADVYHRMGRFLRKVSELHEGASIAAFGHGDPIKTAVMNVLATPMDFVHRIEIYPASTTAIQFDQWGAKVLHVNQVQLP